MNKKFHTFIIFHFINILIFAIIYYLLMLNIDKHFVINNISKDIQKYKALYSITLSSAIESTNGVSDIIPAGPLCKCVTLLQYITTIVITGYFLF